MEEEAQERIEWEGYVDWRRRPAIKGRHGGMVAAIFVLVVEVLENLAFLANASNLVLYLTDYMHFAPSKSANNVTNFMGTAFLLALLGGFLSDAFFTTYHIYLISAVIELMGLVVLTTQARIPSLKPPQCNDNNNNPSSPCQEATGGEAAMLFIGLYMVALGVGGIKGSLPSHGAEQFDHATPKGRKMRSSFFNYFVFSLACGALIAVTLVVWIEDNKGWEWGLGIATFAIFLSIPIFLAGSGTYRNKVPSGSPLTTIVKVLVAATLNKCLTRSPSNAIASMSISPSNHNLKPPEQRPQNLDDDNNNNLKPPEQQPPNPDNNNNNNNNLKPPENQQPTQTLTFLNRALSQCTIQQVEEVKIVLKMLPIFASTIMLNACLAQLSTFSVHQAASMDTTLGVLKLPPASLPVFPVIFIIFLAPIYDHLVVPFARRHAKSESGISHLQRIGIGLVLSVLAMAVAATIEIKRKRVARDAILQNPNDPLPITFLWIAFQYLFLGSADLFTLAGLLEFFFTEAPAGMRSLATALSWASLAMGYYLSSVIVAVVNRATAKGGPWLEGEDLNGFHLDRFYWLMCVLSGVNYLFFLFWAVRYKYRAVDV